MANDDSFEDKFLVKDTQESQEDVDAIIDRDPGLREILGREYEKEEEVKDTFFGDEEYRNRRDINYLIIEKSTLYSIRNNISDIMYKYYKQYDKNYFAMLVSNYQNKFSNIKDYDFFVEATYDNIDKVNILSKNIINILSLFYYIIDNDKEITHIDHYNGKFSLGLYITTNLFRENNFFFCEPKDILIIKEIENYYKTQKFSYRDLKETFVNRFYPNLQNFFNFVDQDRGYTVINDQNIKNQNLIIYIKTFLNTLIFEQNIIINPNKLKIITDSIERNFSDFTKFYPYANVLAEEFARILNYSLERREDNFFLFSRYITVNGFYKLMISPELKVEKQKRQVEYTRKVGDNDLKLIFKNSLLFSISCISVYLASNLIKSLDNTCVPGNVFLLSQLIMTLCLFMLIYTIIFFYYIFKFNNCVEYESTGNIISFVVFMIYLLITVFAGIIKSTTECSLIRTSCDHLLALGICTDILVLADYSIFYFFINK